MPDETINVKYVVTAEGDADIIRGAKEYRKQVDDIKQKLIELSQTSKMSFRDLGESMKKNTMLPTEYISTAVSELTKGAPKVASAWSKIGNVFKNAFSFFLGGSIFAAVMRLIGGFQELIKTGEEYAQTIYRLGVSINQLQRRGLDITIQSEIALIKELQAQYSTFSKKGVIEAVTSVQMLTRNFGFNQEQIKKTIQLSLDLALVQGKDVGETAKMLALFYSSGYGEGLQHAGLAVNRMTVAQEANRIGMHKSYMQLTELERASAAYALITRQTTDLHQDAAKIQDSIIGKIKEQKSEIENVTNEIALRALPVELAWLKVKVYLLKYVTQYTDAMAAHAEAIEIVAKREGKSIDEMTKLVNKPVWSKSFMTKEMQAVYDEEEKIMQAKKSEMENMLTDIFSNVPVGGVDMSGYSQETADAQKKLSDNIMKTWEDIENAKKDYDKQMIELEKQYNDAMEKLDADSAAKRLELWNNYQEDLLKIQEDLAVTIANYELDASRKAGDLDREYQLSIQDSNRKFHEQELKAERDYQERMHKLREGFLFDLEDALRERDARQVLQLIRRYNLEKTQETRAYEEQRKEAEHQHQLDLQDLERQHREEERQNELSLQRQIEDAQAAAKRKEEDAKAAYEKALDDEAAALAKQVEEEKAKAAERQANLDQDLADREAKILEAFGEEVGVTGTSLDTVAKLFAAYLGKQGVVASVIDEYIAKLSAAAEATSDNVAFMEAELAKLQSAAAGLPSNLSPTNLSPGGGINSMPPQAEGGTYLATKPTTVTFGEAGAELASFIPLKQLKANDRQTSSDVLNGDGGKRFSGKGIIELILPKDFEGRIIDNTLGEVAIIMKRGK